MIALGDLVTICNGELPIILYPLLIWSAQGIDTRIRECLMGNLSENIFLEIFLSGPFKPWVHTTFPFLSDKLKANMKD